MHLCMKQRILPLHIHNLTIGSHKSIIITCSEIIVQSNYCPRYWFEYTICNLALQEMSVFHIHVQFLVYEICLLVTLQIDCIDLDNLYFWYFFFTLKWCLGNSEDQNSYNVLLDTAYQSRFPLWFAQPDCHFKLVLTVHRESLRTIKTQHRKIFAFAQSFMYEKSLKRTLNRSNQST